jgi:hypothetical protein
VKRLCLWIILIETALLVAGGAYLGYSTVRHGRLAEHLREIEERERSFLAGIEELEKQGALIEGTGSDIAESTDNLIERSATIDELIERALQRVRTLEALLGLVEDSYGVDLHLRDALGQQNEP